MQFFPTIMLLALPTLAAAQGDNPKVSNCVVTLECSQDGQCETVSETLIFKLNAKNVQRHGEGTYELSFAGTTTEAQMVTPFGPLVWFSKDNQLQTLMGIGQLRDDQDENPVGFLSLSSLTFSQPPTGTVKFLQCRDAE